MKNDTDFPPFSGDEEMAIWIEAVMAEFRDGAASTEDIESLRALLLQNAAARQTYLEANQLSCLLESAAFRPGETPNKREPARRRRIQALWALSGIAAVLVAGFWLLANRDAPEPGDAERVIVTLSASHKAVWEGAGQVDGASFGEGALALHSGIAEIVFQNGARLVLEGPCALHIIDGETVRLMSGKLWAKCPPAASGFEVLAPGGHRIVDLGTEFGVGVDSSGSTDVHVFDGEVEVFPKEQDKQALGAGSAIQLLSGAEPGAKLIAFDADSEHFTSAGELQRERWQAHHADMLQRDDLLLYYDFDSGGTGVEDRSGNGLLGQASGVLSVSGHVPGGKSLLFETPADAVALDFGDQAFASGFTIAMWIKPDELTKSHSTLINSNGFEPGDVHFQISHEGRLLADVCGVGSFRTRRDDFLRTNEWQLVAVTWDLGGRGPRFFHNGIKLPRHIRKAPPEVRGKVANFGQCQIGSWGKPTYGHQRNYVGRMDEVMVFSRALDPAEMQQLYRASQP